jgi:putative nucleotidyltransferase with HDIG domain
MDRMKALSMINARVQNKNLVKHMLAVEAIMREIATKKGADPELWGLAGLLHDLDYSETLNDPANHGNITAKELEGLGVNADIIYAIKSHPGHVPCKSDMDWVLYAADPLSGLIVAAALMHPAKKIANIDTQFVLNRFNERRFAAGANREQIKSCDKFGMTLEEFIGIALSGMQKIAGELGL